MLYRYRSRRYTELTISYSELFKKGKQIKQNRNNNHAQWHPIHKYIKYEPYFCTYYVIKLYNICKFFCYITFKTIQNIIETHPLFTLNLIINFWNC